MAYTIQDQPVNYSPTGAPLVYTTYSDNFTESKFKYIAQIYDNTTGDFLGELKSVPQPTAGWGKFDVSRVVGATLDTMFDPSEDIQSSYKSLKRFEIQFGEEYVNSSGNFVRSTELQSDTRWFFNGSPYWNEFLELRNSNQWYLRDAYTDSLPLTGRRHIQTSEGTKQWLWYQSTRWFHQGKLEIEDLETNEVVHILVPGAYQNDDVGLFMGWRCDSEYLENTTTLTDLNKWRVRMLDPLDNVKTNWVTFENLDCEKWDLYSLYYINRWGGIDSFSFNGRSTIEVRSDRSSYKNNLTPISDTGLVQFNDTTHQERDYNVKQTDIINLQSGWISYSQQVSIVDLQNSQRVWMEDKDGVILPVRVDQESVEINQPNNRVLSVTMTVRYEQPIQRH